MAHAIVKAAQKSKFSKAQDFSTRQPGKALLALLMVSLFALGNIKLMDDLKIDIKPLSAQADRIRGDGATVIFVAISGKAAGLLAIADPIKETTPDAIKSLKAMNIRIVMLTGDNRITAEAISPKTWHYRSRSRNFARR